jgi:thioredoxin reductase
MQTVIIGAGPAGLSCANALLSFGIQPALIERSANIGGAQRANFHPNLWLLGAPPEESGRELTARIAQHFATLPVTIYRDTEVLSVDREMGQWRLQLETPEEGLTLLTHALVLATGTQPRASAQLQSWAQQSPRVRIGPLSEAERDDWWQRRILILGGGDNALDHALLLAGQGCVVDICTRGRLSARSQFIAQCAAHPHIRLHEQCVVTLDAADAVQVSVRFEGQHSVFDGLLVLWGYEPCLAVLERFAPEFRPRLEPSGHVRVDRWQRSSVPHLYACGDVTDTPQPSVAVAVAQGLTAARAIERDLRMQT